MPFETITCGRCNTHFKLLALRGKRVAKYGLARGRVGKSWFDAQVRCPMASCRRRIGVAFEDDPGYVSGYQKNKIKVQTKGRSQIGTGHTVNQGMGPTREWRDRLRAEIHRLGIEEPNIPQAERTKRAERIRGRVNHLRQLMPGKAKRLDTKLAGHFRS